MPTNVLRAQRMDLTKPSLAAGAVVGPGLRVVRLRAGPVALDLALLATTTADVIWRALPRFSTVETWGDSIHFEVPLEAGRDRTARLNGQAGDIYYWAEDDRVVIPWGPTPISGPGEIRLMRPCNVWARTDGDVAALRALTPGERIYLHKIMGKRPAI